ncbi:NfeD family protein [uncultured Chitinophaga sp.]|uniref:NfeD family protein n=1 Tax=uncultured Chitinophaga sp. TaxID=339340 RepID=UPI0025FA7E04|nr:NfeD family protein [uncultured Chitinophaga sp.]
MESFLSATVIWFILGFVLLLLEFAVPGFILCFFGLGAWVVALVTLIFDVSLNVQLLIFLASSILSVVLFRSWIRKKMGYKIAPKDLLKDEIIGKSAKAETPISPNHQGKVYFRGASWGASSTDIIQEGEEVIIIGNDSIILIVKSANSL